MTIPLQLLMLNDIALAGVAGQLFTEIGMHVKDQSLFDRTMVITALAPAGAGDIPTDEAFLMPANRAVGNRLKPGCAEAAIINSFNEMTQENLDWLQGIGEQLHKRLHEVTFCRHEPGRTPLCDERFGYDRTDRCDSDPPEPLLQPW